MYVVCLCFNLYFLFRDCDTCWEPLENKMVHFKGFIPIKKFEQTCLMVNIKALNIMVDISLYILVTIPKANATKCD